MAAREDEQFGVREKYSNEVKVTEHPFCLVGHTSWTRIYVFSVEKGRISSANDYTSLFAYFMRVKIGIVSLLHPFILFSPGWFVLGVLQ
jgi:hypothetical protein